MGNKRRTTEKWEERRGAGRTAATESLRVKASEEM